MDFIEVISNKIGTKIAEVLNLDEDNKEVLIYGAFSIMHVLWSIILVAALGSMFNLLLECLFISFTASLLRRYSGGAHATSSNRCAIVGAIIFLILSILVKILGTYINTTLIFLIYIAGFILAYYIIYKYSPVDTPNKIIRKPEKRQRLKKASINFICIMFVITFILWISYFILRNDMFINVIISIFTGIVWQSLTLTFIGDFVISKLDFCLKAITRT